MDEIEKKVRTHFDEAFEKSLGDTEDIEDDDDEFDEDEEV